MGDSSNFIEILERAKERCVKANKSPTEALWLLEFVTKSSLAQAIATQRELSIAEKNKFFSYLDELCGQHKPLAYILGTVPFCGMELDIRAPILIPRPETEEWVTHLISKIKGAGYSNKPFRFLDLCTGSGCIALALCKAFPLAQGIGVDINPEAIVLADHNRLKIEIDQKRASFICGDAMEFCVNSSSGLFDLIVCNPPYLAENELETAVGECPSLVWEDEKALVAFDSEKSAGLRFYYEILGLAGRILRDRVKQDDSELSWIVFEVGHQQGVAVAEIARKADFEAVILVDSAKKDRVVWCSRDFKSGLRMQ